MINYFKQLKKIDYIKFFFLILVSIILIRCINLQFTENIKYVSEIQKREIRKVTIKANRGVIVDRNKNILADSILLDTLEVNNPKIFLNENDKENIQKLCGIINKKCPSLLNSIKRKQKKKSIYIKRQISSLNQINEIKKLKLKGVAFRKEPKRFYPEGETFASLIGKTNIDHIGGMGLELSFETHLKESDGQKIVRQDKNTKYIEDISLVSEPKNGKDLELTIDKRLQYVAFRELKKQINFINAKSGSVVILDTTNGDILAAASYPSYDPNDRNSYTKSAERNRAIVDSLEPASTIKPFLVAAALHSGKVNLGDIFDTSPGYIKFGKKIYRDNYKNHGPLTLEGIILKSSNVGSILISNQFDKKIYHELLEYVGIGEMVNINFPSEIQGELNHHTEWQDSDLRSHALGYALKVTPLQLAKAYSVIANEGIVIHPRILKNISIQKNKDQKYKTSFIKIKEILKKNVESGTGYNAAVKGYSVGGKTGTAELYTGNKNEKYDNKEHISLFAGITPITNPKLVIVVVISEPKTKARQFFGSKVSAPVFSKIATDSLRILNISPDNIKDYQNQVSAEIENTEIYTLKTPEVHYVF